MALTAVCLRWVLACFNVRIVRFSAKKGTGDEKFRFLASIFLITPHKSDIFVTDVDRRNQKSPKKRRQTLGYCTAGFKKWEYFET
jgi:hypothetical protein